MPATNGTGKPMPEGIFSILDTDLYKLTMQCAVLKYFPDVHVAYRLSNRTSHMRLTQKACSWLQEQIDKFANVTLREDEKEWLQRTCPYLTKEHLEYLSMFRFKPKEHINVSFTPELIPAENDTPGDLSISVHGLWLETILYEIPLLALVSECYFKFVDTDWTHGGQVEQAAHKGTELLRNGCVFSEFGSRRRRDYKTHELVMRGLVQAKDSADPSWKGKWTGTSNVHLAMRFGVMPIGTVAHEWFMGIASITNDYSKANELALQYWIGTFGRGVLGIALTDTFGTPSFLKAFAKLAPRSDTTDTAVSDQDPTFAQIFTGTRQDSGDPMEFLRLMKKFYASQHITEPKTIVYSDSLNVEKCIKYKKATEEAGLVPSFGVGTFFTNDFHRLNDGQKSVPLNIVIKLSEAGGRAAVKLSDNDGKNTGPEELVKKVKAAIGYQQKEWVAGDESHRWDEEKK